MKLKQLLEYQTEINSLVFIHKRPKNKLTEFIINGYLSFYGMGMNEARFYKPSGYKGSDKMFSNKVTFMKKDIDSMIDKIDHVANNFPELINDYIFPKIENGIHFIKELDKFFKWVNKINIRKVMELDYSINDKSLSQLDINYFKKINNGIISYNSLIDELETMFSKPVIDPTHNIVFNDIEVDFSKVIKETLSFKLELLDIPENPIMEEYPDNFIDADYEQL